MQSNILSSITELGLIFKKSPDLIDRDLVKKGREVVSLYFDSNFSSSMANYLEIKKKLLNQVILDLSSGGSMLKTYRLGIVYTKGKFVDFAVPYAEANPTGTIAATISVKSIRAFDRHRTQPDATLTPDEINMAIYYLISELAFL